MSNDKEQGSATVELAIGMIGLMVVLALAVAGLSVASAQGGACADAREALRSAVRGASPPPSSSQVHVSANEEWITVTARKEVRVGGAIGWPVVECSVTGLSEEGLAVKEAGRE